MDIDIKKQGEDSPATRIDIAVDLTENPSDNYVVITLYHEPGRKKHPSVVKVDSFTADPLGSHAKEMKRFLQQMLEQGVKDDELTDMPMSMPPTKRPRRLRHYYD